MKMLLLGLSMLFALAGCKQDTYNEMKRVFVAPRNEVQTTCYWYWISGNVSKEGVMNDLKAMKKAGINRAFIGFQGLLPEEAPRGPVYIQSDEWYDIVHTALKTATEEGIEIGIFNGPGWSQAGGPWVKPEQSMRYLASQRVSVIGGEECVVNFDRPADFLETVKVLAYKRKSANSEVSAKTDQIVAKGVKNIDFLFDHDTTTMAEVIKGKSSITIKPRKKNFRLRSLRTEIGSPILADISIKAKKDGKMEEVAHFTADRTNMMIEIGYYVLAPLAISIPEVESEEYRIDIENRTDCKIKELVFSEAPIVESFADKILGKMHQTPQPLWTDYKWTTRVHYSPDVVVGEDDVVDLTPYLKEDCLIWNCPEGDWEVVRTYMAPTKINNGPSLDGDGRGLEVDRWNSQNLKHHYESFIREIMRRVPAQDRKTWKVIVCDSYEKATQNYGDDFVEYFQKHFGYNPVPYLLTYDGVVVESAEKSDRFLWDLRRMIADRLAYDHIGGMRKLAHEDGMKLWLESYGHWGFPGEFLQYGGQADEVAGEFWSEGTLGDIENRAASSAGHIYGKKRISAESFTCGGAEFSRSPRHMKQRGDKFFTEGINSSLLHLVVSQMDETTLPGLNCPFGNEFNRKNTWYSHLDLFTDYLKRCNYLLQQGEYVADVAYFIGEDVPVMYGLEEPKLPCGYQFDFINAEVMINSLTADADHTLKLPCGLRYKLLVLPPNNTMRPAVLSRIKTLIEDGGIVLAQAKPDKSPSLQNYPYADQEVKALADELWGSEINGRFERKIGKGVLYSGYSIEEIFAKHDVCPDFHAVDTEALRYAHTAMKDLDIYFVANQEERIVDFLAEFRTIGRVPELWSPIDGHVRELKSYAMKGNVTQIPMRLLPQESVFVVFAKTNKEEELPLSLELNYPTRQDVMILKDDWNITLRSMVNDGKILEHTYLQDLSQSDDDYVKYFSGTATYTNTFELGENIDYKRLVLNLGTVYEMAKVKINGKEIGGVWTAPYILDVTEAVKPGENQIEVIVVNNWINRLVGDSRLDDSERNTSCSYRSHNPSTPLQPSGLLGPVKLQCE